MKQQLDEIQENLIANWDVLKSIDIKAEIESCRYICIFGTGDWYRYAHQNYEPFISGKLDFLCDNNQELWGEIINGKKCISPDELSQYKDEVFVFVAVKNPKPIFKQLRELGLIHMNIIDPWVGQNYEKNRFDSENWRENIKEELNKTISLLADDLSIKTIIGVLKSRYSIPPIYENYSAVMSSTGEDYFYDTPLNQHLTKQEVFFDIGAYTGDTLKQFIKIMNGQFSKIYSIELDQLNFYELKKSIGGFDSGIRNKIEIFNCGLGEIEEKVFYKPSLEATMVERGTLTKELFEGEIKVYDDLFREVPVTLLKLDVEGMEIEVLNGARNSIQEYRPKMAISIYHKNDHIWKIPQLIKEMNPDYKLYIRHQACINVSTILYCI
jgi:FkbM family methyltransferase